MQASISLLGAGGTSPHNAGRLAAALGSTSASAQRGLAAPAPHPAASPCLAPAKLISNYETRT